LRQNSQNEIDLESVTQLDDTQVTSSGQSPIKRKNTQGSSVVNKKVIAHFNTRPVNAPLSNVDVNYSPEEDVKEQNNISPLEIIAKRINNHQRNNS
jgi:hypothetical protein